jgi:hypothetical protein
MLRRGSRRKKRRLRLKRSQSMSRNSSSQKRMMVEQIRLQEGKSPQQRHQLKRHLSLMRSGMFILSVISESERYLNVSHILIASISIKKRSTSGKESQGLLVQASRVRFQLRKCSLVM